MCGAGRGQLTQDAAATTVHTYSCRALALGDVALGASRPWDASLQDAALAQLDHAANSHAEQAKLREGLQCAACAVTEKSDKAVL